MRCRAARKSGPRRSRSSGSRSSSRSKRSSKTVTREQVAQARELGKDAATGKPITVRMGRFGPFVQIGTKDDEEKPRFAGLRPGQKMDAITLAEAMELFKLPRTLGATAEGEPIVANVGRFGPYVKYGAKYVSLKEDDPYTVTLERALEVIRLKQEADANRIIQDFARRRHPGAERPLRTVHHRQEEERQDPQGSRSEDPDARGVQGQCCSPLPSAADASAAGAVASAPQRRQPPALPRPQLRRRVRARAAGRKKRRRQAASEPPPAAAPARRAPATASRQRRRQRSRAAEGRRARRAQGARPEERGSKAARRQGARRRAAQAAPAA